MEQQNVGSKRSASGASGKIAAKSHEAAEQLKETVAEGAERVREKARSAKEHTSERIRGVANQLQNMSESLRENDPLTAGLAERASRGIESVAHYVNTSDATTLLRDTERLARRQPALFFGSAFLIGLAAGRFLKSSSPQSDFSRGYDDDEGGPLARPLERESGFFYPPAERSARSNQRYQQNYDATFGRDLNQRDTYDRTGSERGTEGSATEGNGGERYGAERYGTERNGTERNGTGAERNGTGAERNGTGAERNGLATGTFGASEQSTNPGGERVGVETPGKAGRGNRP